MKKSVDKILLVKTHAMGDILMCTPAFHAIRKGFAGAEIVLLTGKTGAQIVRKNRDIDRLIEIDESVLFDRKIMPLCKLIFRMRGEKFALACIFQPSRAIQILIRLAGIPVRVGLDGKGGGPFLTNPVKWRAEPGRYVGEDFCDVARTLGLEANPGALRLEIDKEDRTAAAEFLSMHGLTEGKYALIFPGGGKNPRDTVLQKQWRPEGFADVIRYLRDRGVNSLVLGGPDDAPVIREVVSRAGGDGIASSSSLSVGISSALIQTGKLVVTNDSLPLHIARALHKPTLCIFGPTDHRALLDADEKCVIPVVSCASCAPCYANSPFPGCNRTDCIDSITTDLVLSGLSRLLENADEYAD